MPVFISYSHADKVFVDNLAMQLVVNRVAVWLDKWEIHAGDSLLTKVQNAISGASALIVVLSKASVKSEWCTKELNAGLMRELDEKRVVVVPVIIEKCQIPTFLREKMYADFRDSFDHGLRTILESIARITNATQGRIEGLHYHTDWAIDWGDINGRDVFTLTMIDHSKEQPFTILSEVTIIGDNAATRWYKKHVASGTGQAAREEILFALEAEVLGDGRFTFILTNQIPMQGFTTFDLLKGTFGATTSVRRLGMDTGRDIVMRIDDQVKNVCDSIRALRANGIKHPSRKASSTRKRTVKKRPLETKKSKAAKKNASTKAPKKK